MVKEQFRETNIATQICSVEFQPFSAKDISRQACIQIINTNLYVQDTAHKACQYGVLDHRMVRVSISANFGAEVD
jgi:hypothetical protein